MAKHKYEELEVDEYNLAIHWRERDGDEYWGINEYKPNGRIKDVHITHVSGWTEFLIISYLGYSLFILKMKGLKK